MPSSDSSPSKRRARANTSDLVLPRPENSPADYTRERVKEALQYSKQRLDSQTRKVTPTSRRMLALYRSACSDHLTEDRQGKLAQDKARQEELSSQIRKMELDLQDKNWAIVCPDAQGQRFQDELLRLYEYQYYGRYGDYLQRVAHKLRMTARTLKLAGWGQLSANVRWTEISDKILADDLQTKMAVYNACDALETDPEEAMFAIHRYASRNRLLHSSLDEDMKAKRYGNVARILFDDIHNLEHIIPPKREFEADFVCMSHILQQLIKEWFVMHNLDEYLSWVPTQQLFDDCAALRQSDRRSPERTEAIATAAARNLQIARSRAATREELWQQVGAAEDLKQLPLKGPVAVPSKKRTASGSSSIDVEHRDRLWSSIRLRQRSLVDLREEALDAQIRQNHEVSVYHDTWGSPVASQSPEPRSPEQPESSSQGQRRGKK